MLISVMSSSTAYMELSSLRVKDKAMYCWARNSVGTSGQNKLPCRETQEQQGTHESSSYTLYHLYSTHTLSLATMPVSQSLGIIQKERAA